MSRTLRLVFFGTPEFAVPSLERLQRGPHRVVGVVTQPDRRRGRGRAASPSPVAERALQADIPLLRPERIGAPEAIGTIEAWKPDLGIVVAFGQFIPKRVRHLPALGYLINAHASLLPSYRGAAPIAHAILGGETQTGISVMRVEREMDAGAVALVREIPIGDDEDTGRLTGRLAVVAADALETAVARIADGSVRWIEQDASRASFAPKIEREDARLDWSEPAESLSRRVRAMAPRPGAWTGYRGGPLRILAAHADRGTPDVEPGMVRRSASDGLRVATGNGWLVPTILQKAGGRALPVGEFLRGTPIDDGERLGNEPPAATIGP